MLMLKEMRPAEFFNWIDTFGAIAYVNKHPTLIHAAHQYAVKTNESLSLPTTPTHIDIAVSYRALCVKLHLPWSSEDRLGRALARECVTMKLPIVGGVTHVARSADSSDIYGGNCASRTCAADISILEMAGAQGE